jgi:hypothetical protein
MSIHTTFPRYGRLPYELKRQIVSEAVAELFHLPAAWFQRQHRPPRTGNHVFARHACIDLVWQEIIERNTFRSLALTPRCIKDFGRICGKRHGILHRITLCINPADIFNMSGPHDFCLDCSTILSLELNDSLQALFSIMKDWRCEERRRREPVELCLDFTYLDSGRMTGPGKIMPIRFDFLGLPTVSVIGRFWETTAPLLHPSSAISIYSKLPNLNQAALRFFWQPTESGFSQETMGKMAILQPVSINPYFCLSSLTDDTVFQMPFIHFGVSIMFLPTSRFYATGSKTTTGLKPRFKPNCHLFSALPVLVLDGATPSQVWFYHT